MLENVKDLSCKIDATIQLCKNVLEYGEKIKDLSPFDIGIETYAEILTRYTEDRGRATRTAMLELSNIRNGYATIESDSAIAFKDKAFLTEKIRSVQDLAPLFAKQSVALRKIIGIHLNSLRKESVEFHNNVGVIKNYLSTPDKRTFYG